MASGKVSLYKHQLQLTNPKFIILDSPDQIKDDAFNGPIYPASAELTSTQIRRIIKPILNKIAGSIPEFYNSTFRKKTNLITRAQALTQIHAPENEQQLAGARRRLKYDELFLMQLALALKHYHARNTAGGLWQSFRQRTVFSAPPSSTY